MILCIFFLDRRRTGTKIVSDNDFLPHWTLFTPTLASRNPPMSPRLTRACMCASVIISYLWQLWRLASQVRLILASYRLLVCSVYDSRAGLSPTDERSKKFGVRFAVN